MRLFVSCLWCGVFLFLGACGKKGDLVYEGETRFPRQYPQPIEENVALAQQKR